MPVSDEHPGGAGATPGRSVRPGHDLERLIDRLVRHTTPTGQHTDDIAVLLLRASPLRACRLRDGPA